MMLDGMLVEELAVTSADGVVSRSIERKEDQTMCVPN